MKLVSYTGIKKIIKAATGDKNHSQDSAVKALQGYAESCLLKVIKSSVVLMKAADRETLKGEDLAAVKFKRGMSLSTIVKQAKAIATKLDQKQRELGISTYIVKRLTKQVAPYRVSWEWLTPATATVMASVASLAKMSGKVTISAKRKQITAEDVALALEQNGSLFTIGELPTKGAKGVARPTTLKRIIKNIAPGSMSSSGAIEVLADYMHSSLGLIVKNAALLQTVAGRKTLKPEDLALLSLDGDALIDAKAGIGELQNVESRVLQMSYDMNIKTRSYVLSQSAVKREMKKLLPKGQDRISQEVLNYVSALLVDATASVSDAAYTITSLNGRKMIAERDVRAVLENNNPLTVL